MSSLIYLFISCCYVIVITIITVITFDDEIRELPNPDEKRRKLKEAAREVTGSEPRDVFLIANSIPDKEFDPAYKKEVLKMLEQALKCGERSIKMRQVQRESPKRSISEPQGRAEKSPVENTEEPNYKSWPGWLYDQVSNVRSIRPRKKCFECYSCLLFLAFELLFSFISFWKYSIIHWFLGSSAFR